MKALSTLWTLLNSNINTLKRDTQRVSLFISCSLDCSCYLVGTKASGANTDGLRCAIHHSLNLSEVGFPGSVASSVRVADLNTKHHALTANFTFCHLSYTSQIYKTKYNQENKITLFVMIWSLFYQRHKGADKPAKGIISKNKRKCKYFLSFFKIIWLRDVKVQLLLCFSSA